MTKRAEAATTQRYAHLAADPIKKAVDTVTSNIAAAMNGKGTETIEVNGAKR